VQREVRTVVAVRVSGNVEASRGEVILERGASVELADGHLIVKDVREDPIAIFAPGQWLAVKVDDKFTCRTDGSQPHSKGNR
jgi:hypothetical protein